VGKILRSSFILKGNAGLLAKIESRWLNQFVPPAQYFANVPYGVWGAMSEDDREAIYAPVKEVLPVAG
jgi:hypothetical protein